MYTRQTWNNGDKNTPLSAARLNHIEAGLEAVSIPEFPDAYTFVADGDSITIGSITNNVSGSVNQDRVQNWPTYMMLASNGRAQLLYNAGVSGQRLDQALTRFDTFVAPHNPDVVFLTIGTNDVGTGRTLAAYLADLDTYLAKVRAIGATLVLGAIWPVNNDADRQAKIVAFNSGLRSWAGANGVRVVPFDAFRDPTTGGWPVGWSTDNIHPLPEYRQTIGVFAWEAVQDMFPNRVMVTADKFGSGGLGNGLFTTLTASLPAPATVTGTPTVGTGNLPAGTYSYRVSTRETTGESLLSGQAVVTLSGTGQIAITISAVSQNRGYRVYRKGPLDVDWFLVGEPGTSASPVTWTDTGAVAGEKASGIDTSQRPADASVGSLTPMRMDGGIVPAIISDPAIRGNWVRMRPLVSGGVSTYLLTPTINVVPGDVIEFTGLVRGDGRNMATVYARGRNAATQVFQMKVFEGVPLPGFEPGRFHCRVVVPEGCNNMLPVIGCSAGDGYVEFAEVRAVKVS